MLHGHDRYEKLFAPRVLFGIIVVIGLAAETVGGGRAFAADGVMYIPAFLFTALVAVRIIGRLQQVDTALRSFLYAVLASLAISFTAYGIDAFARNASSIVRASAFETVVALQLAALLTFALGTLYILRSYGAMREAYPLITASSFIGVAAFGFALAAYFGLVSNVPPMLYTLVAAMTGMTVVVSLHRVERLLPFLKDFVRALSAAGVFMALSAAANTVHLIAGSEPFIDRQATYGAYLAAYTACCMIFVALGRMVDLGPEYQRLNAMKAAKKG